MCEVDHIPFGAYPIAVIEELGGWDESIPANEDFEFDYRVRASGRTLLFDPSMVIFWETRQSVTAFFEQYRRYGRGKAIVVSKHPESASPRHLIPAGVVAALVGAAVLAPFRPRLAAAVALPYAGIIAAATLATAPSVADGASRRWLPAAFAAMHLGYGWGFWESWVARWRPGS